MGAKLKASHYNYWFPYKRGMLVFNGASRALSLVGLREFNELERVLTSEEPFDPSDYQDGQLRSTIADLNKGRFVVEADRNEVELLRKRSHIFQQVEPFFLTIATTMDCNLGCYYCFEEKYSSYMDRNVCDLIHAYAIQEIERHPENRHFYVQWFGGEPMLNTDCIEYLSAKFVELCQKKGVHYHGSMISNGAAWPETATEILSFVERNHVSRVQFTFDGLPTNHNKRRRYVKAHTGLSSFDAMCRTISALVGHVHISLRMHCDPGNRDDLYGLVDFFVARGWLYPGCDVFPYAARIMPVSETCDFLQNHTVNVSEFDELDSGLRRYVAQFVGPTEYASVFLPKPVKVLCTAMSKTSLAIGPDGYVYKCTGEIGDHSKSQGHLRNLLRTKSSSELLPILQNTGTGSSMNDYSSFDAFAQQTCSVCKYLPLCMSGCPKQQLEKYRFNQNKANIDEFRRYWDESLEGLVTSYADSVLEKSLVS